jgi:predicted nuclease with TOPRIM domain
VNYIELLGAVDYGALIGVVGGFLGVIGVVSAAVVVARSGIAQNTITVLEKNTDALDKRVEIMEAENKQLRDRVDSLETLNAALLAQIKSVPEYGQLVQTTAERFSEVLTEISALTVEHRQIIELLREVAKK